ncbi:DBH-like monooxygenase protein 1 isoform X1 [Petromyzon marinus]|uniref:DBH-like monooxygenase protein 1 isoform X1 n=1 Tax=Petromyzon marinus TaxID=7757 RepID=UPI003F70890E
MLCWTRRALEALLWLCLAAGLGSPSSRDSRSWERSAELDEGGRVRLSWSATRAGYGDESGGQRRESIAFRVEARTTGWVGLGFSPAGSMAGADLVIGGVTTNGKPYLQDYFAERNERPLLDERQDYRLESASQNSTHTELIFSRALDTCDSHDKIIASGTVRVLWAVHAEDVEDSSGDPLGDPSGARAQYHGAARGVRSLNLLNPASEVPGDLGLTDAVDLCNHNVEVPSSDTTYWCQIFRLPELHTKHHVIRVEPLVKPGHEGMVHHILLYQCALGLHEAILQSGHRCYQANMPEEFRSCESILFAWAIGGGAFLYPPHVGLSLGEPGDPVFVLMETHYDNPLQLSGIRDNSGLRLHYTAQLRAYDAGVMETGVWVSLYHMVPPHAPHWVSQGHCTRECLNEALGTERPQGVSVFAVLLHAHLVGRELLVRHWRGDRELPLLARDSEYDFNFQELHMLPSERLLLPGDHLTTECVYNTEGRVNMTWGGQSTHNEMCLAYVLYYPRVNLSRCQSLPEINGQLAFIGVTDIYKPVTTWPFLIKDPIQYRNLTFTEAMDRFRWGRRQRRHFNQLVLRLPVNIRCSKYELEEWSVQGMVTNPEVQVPWTSLNTSIVCPTGVPVSGHHRGPRVQGEGLAQGAQRKASTAITVVALLVLTGSPST